MNTKKNVTTKMLLDEIKGGAFLQILVFVANAILLMLLLISLSDVCKAQTADANFCIRSDSGPIICSDKNLNGDIATTDATFPALTTKVISNSMVVSEEDFAKASGLIDLMMRREKESGVVRALEKAKKLFIICSDENISEGCQQ